MTDANFYNYQTYDTQVGEIGATNVLPTIQGTTEVLPAIGGDYGTTFTQGENTVLQDTAGLGGTTTTTGYYDGTTTDTNTFYGTTQEYPTTTTDNNVIYGGEQVLQATAEPTSYFGETQVTTDNNTFFTGTTTTDNTAVYGTTFTGTNDFQGTTQILPATNVDVNTFFAGDTTQIPETVQNITTTTQTTTYNVAGATSTPIQTTFGTTQIPTTNQVTTVGNVQTNIIPGTVAQNQINQKQEPVVAQTQGQLRKSNLEAQQKLPGGRVYDEDFRRGRPAYNDRYYGSKYEMPRLLPRPSYNTGINNQGLPSKIVGVNQVSPIGVNNINNVGLGVNPGLNRLARGVSYDVYGRGINPLLINAGLGPINNNLQPNQKALGNIKDFL